ncbi:MAG TPA: efflux RND transporter periplasmic adaptor subunit [Phycisphaerae bacterium]|nr:efflux RND transporter periplasmic adaptor subunit [Phycisphaerae bacterium]
MTAPTSPTTPLPLLRPEVEVLPGPEDADGAPTYVIHDPLHGTFDQATWVQGQILNRLRRPVDLDRLLKELSAHTTIKVAAEDVQRLCADASHRGLTIAARGTARPEARAHPPSPSRGPLDTLLRGLLYVRIPLVHPDAFLTRTVGWVRPLVGRWALLTYVLVGLAAAVLLLQRFDAYLATFPYFFNVRGVGCFTAALVLVKVAHELAHAYVAKALGNRVSSMGVAFVLLFPVAYSDVTDSWRMRDRRKRLLIGLAGVLTELVMAGFAVCLWAVSPPGVLRSICFVLSSTALLSTLAINLNPAARFDGYYVLSDLLGIDNLQRRSFAAARWMLHRYLLGMNVPPPEVGQSRGRWTCLLAYAVGAWTYRLFLYLGIALLMYVWVARLVGAVLFVVAIWVFVAKPVLAEFAGIVARCKRLGWNLRLAAVATGAGVFLLWAGLPLPRRTAVPATTVPRDSQTVYATGSGVIRDLAVTLGDPVRKGQTLFRIESQELDTQATLARLEAQRLGIELAVAQSDERRRALLPQKSEELARVTARLRTIEAARAAGRVVAELDGVVVAWDESLRDGSSIGTRKAVGKIVSSDVPRVVCYVRHDLVAHLAVGDRVRFTASAGPGRVGGVVTNVDPLRTTFLEHRGLASTARGAIAVAPNAHGRLEMLESHYAVEVAVDGPTPPVRLGQLGTVWLRTGPRSYLAELVTYAYRVGVRESAF